MSDQVAAAIMDSIVELNKRAKRIAELEAKLLCFADANARLSAESAQWQESSGQNYVRACEAEAREGFLRDALQAIDRLSFKEVAEIKLIAQKALASKAFDEMAEWAQKNGFYDRKDQRNEDL